MMATERVTAATVKRAILDLRMCALTVSSNIFITADHFFSTSPYPFMGDGRVQPDAFQAGYSPANEAEPTATATMAK